MTLVGQLYFYLCAALALFGAISSVAARNPIRGALGLMVMILAIAGLFLALHAQFVAAIQLIVYAGAVVVLFLFVIMLLGPDAAPSSDMKGLLARVVGGGLFAAFTLGLLALVAKSSRPMPLGVLPQGFGGVDVVGKEMFTKGLVPFELSSGLLMVSAIGAVAIARGKQGLGKGTPAAKAASGDDA